MLLESQAKSGPLHVTVEMLLKLSDHVPVDGSPWIKNQLSVNKFILKDICGNFYRYLCSDIFTILHIKNITENGIGEKSPRFIVWWFGLRFCLVLFCFEGGGQGG